ncbi:hypothetical protein TYRP_020172 [Tyrophagus putrescentiae]|nr:hypothetical protein TYRP_020172 [Tyrophagus putrescentiae]
MEPYEIPKQLQVKTNTQMYFAIPRGSDLSNYIESLNFHLDNTKDRDELAAFIVDAFVLRNFPIDAWARKPIKELYKKAVPTAGELLMLDLEGNRRYRQAKENLVSTPPTPITFTDL